MPQRITIHAFLALFVGIAFFICLTGTGWFGTETTAWISAILSLAGWGLLLLIARIINRDYLKTQKYLNKRGYYLLNHGILVTNRAGGDAGVDELSFCLHLENRVYVFTGASKHNIPFALVRKIIGDDKRRQYLLVFYKEETPEVYVSTTKTASLT